MTSSHPVRIISTALIILLLSVLGGCTVGLGKRAQADGGIFISTNSGETWDAKNFVGQQEDRTITIASLDASFLVFDPQDPLVMYFISRGSGIYLTTDGGERWIQTPLHTGTYAALIVDPDNSNILYAAQGTKIIKSIDGMNTWSTVYLETRPQQTITSMAIDPANPANVYATTQKSVMRSDDYGTTWQPTNWDSNQEIVKLLISKRDPSVMYIYARNYGFFRSTNGARDWTDLSEGLKSFSGAKTVNWIDFHPLTDRLTIATNYGILTSIDSAQSWTPLETIIEYQAIPIKTVAVNPANLNEIFFTVRDVLYKTVDGGDNWKTLDAIPTSRRIASLYVSPHVPGTLYAGTESAAQ